MHAGHRLMLGRPPKLLGLTLLQLWAANMYALYSMILSYCTLGITL